MWNRLAAEFQGTFALVFAGTGAIIVNDLSRGAVTHVGIALTFGLIVTAMIYALGETSGAHFNPAVTLAFCLAGRFKASEIVPYWIAQCSGALTASLILRFMFWEHESLGATNPVGSEARAFGLETILTFLLMFVILHVSSGARERGIMAGAAIGATVMLEAMFAGPISGASMNPARSLAPAVVGLDVSRLWIYLIAPVLGAALAVGGYRLSRPTSPVNAKLESESG